MITDLLFIERYFSKVDKSPGYGPNGDCWKWTGSKSTRKKRDAVVICYGNIKYKGKTCRAHRISWEIHFGESAGNLYVCHRCDNPECVNPNHLFLGTHQDNMNDREAKGRTKPGDGSHVALSGESHPMAKITKEIVNSIRNSKDSTRVVGKKFNISATTVSRIRNKKLWKNYN